MVERVYGGSSLNIAVQDGVDAGQSVEHVHTHIIPRRRLDLEHRGGTDAVYEMLDGEEGDLKRSFTGVGREGNGRETGRGTGRRFPAVDNEEREPRGLDDMRAEAEMLAREMEGERED